MVFEKNIKIAIDSYNDLFSDFDISPFEERSISLDFKEALESKIIENNPIQLKIIFSIPSKERKNKDEQIIIKRLNQFFVQKHNNYSKHINSRRFNGLKYILMGFFFITLTFIFETFFTDLFPLYLANIIMILGWFGIWTGIEKILDVPYELLAKKEMYNSFSKSKIKFVAEEEITNKTN